MKQRGFSLVEVLVAAGLVLVLAVASLGLSAQGVRSLGRSQKMAAAQNAQRAAVSFLRALSFSTVRSSTPTTLQPQLRTAIAPEMAVLDTRATASITAITAETVDRLYRVDGNIVYPNSGTTATVSFTVRVARRGLNP